MKESVRIGNERCPHCAKQGKDRHADNLVRYDDGHAFCFACGYRERSTNGLAWARKQLKLHDPSTHVFSELDDILGELTYEYPATVREWLDKYQITELECIRNQIQWCKKRELLVLPIVSHISSKIVATSSRYFGSNPNHPKYINDYFASREEVIKASIKSPEGDGLPALVLVEDIVSSIKVARVAHSVPLLGTHATNTLRNYLIGYSLSRRLAICPWLDPDKKAESIKYSRYFRQYLKSYPILTDKDPKYYNNAELHDFVHSALECAGMFRT